MCSTMKYIREASWGHALVCPLERKETDVMEQVGVQVPADTELGADRAQ